MLNQTLFTSSSGLASPAPLFISSFWSISGDWDTGGVGDDVDSGEDLSDIELLLLLFDFLIECFAGDTKESKLKELFTSDDEWDELFNELVDDKERGESVAVLLIKPDEL